MKRRCADPGCGEPCPATGKYCRLHSLVRKQELDYFFEEDRAERLRELESVPRREEDDWRPRAVEGAGLPRSAPLFELEDRLRRARVRAARTGAPRPPQVEHRKHGLWPPELRLAGAELSRDVDHALATLHPTEDLVLRMRFGLPGTVAPEGMCPVDAGGGEEMTLDEVGDALGVSGERARQLEYAALRTLRGRKLRKILLPHLDPSSPLLR